MDNLMVILFILATIAIPVFIVFGIKKKDKSYFKKAGVSLALAIIGFIGVGIFADSNPQEAEAESPEAEKVSEKEGIKVDIEVTSIIEEEEKVYIEGKTNLPDYAELMITVTDNEYRGQTKTVVKNGLFKTEAFTSKDEKLPQGEYALSISLGIPSTQDDKFIQEAGNDYEYLIGDLMKESELGKSMSYSTTFEVKESVDNEIEEEVEEAKEVIEEETTEREDIVGTSDGNIDDIDKLKPRDMRNDTTGNWKLVTTSKNIDIKEYGKSYAEKYMDDGEVHVLVNFATSTTTIINKNSGMIFANVHEYVKKEEHDAKKAGTGMVLASYNIYLDNGDVQDAM